MRKNAKEEKSPLKKFLRWQRAGKQISGFSTNPFTVGLNISWKTVTKTAPASAINEEGNRRKQVEATGRANP